MAQICFRIFFIACFSLISYGCVQTSISRTLDKHSLSFLFHTEKRWIYNNTSNKYRLKGPFRRAGHIVLFSWLGSDEVGKISGPTSHTQLSSQLFYTPQPKQVEPVVIEQRDAFVLWWQEGGGWLENMIRTTVYRESQTADEGKG